MLLLGCKNLAELNHVLSQPEDQEVLSRNQPPYDLYDQWNQEAEEQERNADLDALSRRLQRSR
jgi:hypothetical protein